MKYDKKNFRQPRIAADLATTLLLQLLVNLLQWTFDLL